MPTLKLVTKKTLERTHSYRDKDGVLQFEKLIYRLENGEKTASFRKPNGIDGKWIYRDCIPKCPPLYNLPQILEAPQESIIHITEGEKDADTLMALGFLATTNYDGAHGKFRKHYADALKGRKIVLYEDKDDAGKSHTQHWLAQLVDVAACVKIWRCPEAMPDHSDVSDYLATFGSYTEGLSKLFEELKNLPFEDLEASRMKKATAPWLTAKDGDKASHNDYMTFIRSLPAIRDIRRDILTDEVYIQVNGKWCPALNELGYFRAHARDYGRFFVLERFPDAIKRAKNEELEPRLLEDFPTWDGEDRVQAIAQSLECKNLSQQEVEEALKAWGAGVFKRLNNPAIQPITLVFLGCQGLGKDALIDALTGGFGSLVKHLSLAGQDFTEAKRQLHTALIFRVSEFDKTAKRDISALKEILTANQTNERLAYDPRPEDRIVRCSFIGSANRADILVDSSGNRRFWLFNWVRMGLAVREIEGVTVGTGETVTSYPGLFSRSDYINERLQIAAQFKQLASDNYQASKETLAKLYAFSCQKTPDSINDLIIQEYIDRVNLIDAIPAKIVDGVNYYRLHQISDVLDCLQKDYRKGRNYILNLLKLVGFKRKFELANMYTNRLEGLEDLKTKVPGNLPVVSTENDLLF